MITDACFDVMDEVDHDADLQDAVTTLVEQLALFNGKLAVKRGLVLPNDHAFYDAVMAHLDCELRNCVYGLARTAVEPSTVFKVRSTR